MEVGLRIRISIETQKVYFQARSILSVSVELAVRT